MNLLDTFDKEIELEFQGERYLVRDNGSVLRKNQYRKKARPNDNKWSFGVANASSGYMFLSGLRVHRLVCTAFHGVPDDPNLVVDHIDTNRQNNRPENLRWLTRLENILLNPITSKRIILAYGSLEAFFDNPQSFQSKGNTENIQWMRTVSKDEAQRTYDNLLEWSKSGSLYSGGELSEWVYKERMAKAISEPEASPSAISSQIDEWRQQGELRHSNYNSYRQEIKKIYFESNTSTALQVEWRTRTEFPLCPEKICEDVLEIYQSAMKFGEVFSRNIYGCSKIVQSYATKDALIVLTRIDEEQPKNWAVAHLSADEEFVYHKNLGTFYDLQGALKEYCIYAGVSYDESFDDYIR